MATAVSRRMLAGVLLPPSVVLLVVVALASPLAASASDPREEAVCRAVVEPASAGDPYPASPPRTDTGFRLSCNKEIRRFTFRTSKPLERVYGRTRIENGTPDDRVLCRSLSEAVGLCSGEANSGARVFGAFRIKGSPCGVPRLATRFRVHVGPDSDGPSTNEGYGPVVVRVAQPRGC